MAVRMKVSTKGMQDALAALAETAANIDQVASEMILAGGEVLQDGMRQRAPKDTHNLENKIALDGPHQDGNYHYAEVGLPRSVDADTARYGTAQEFGTANMAAQPYIRPTVDRDKTKARRAMIEVARSATK